MGALDFVSFIQRNGQNLQPLETGGETSEIYYEDDPPPEGEELEDWLGDYNVSDAILVKVPETEDPAEILKWPLARFAEFESISSRYTADEGWFFDFEEDDDLDSPGTYMNVLRGGGPDDHCVWKSKHYPGFWLVNFLKGEYEAFVSLDHQIDPNTIYQEYYREVFAVRGRETPFTKKEAFDIIARSFSTLTKRARAASAASSASSASAASAASSARATNTASSASAASAASAAIPDDDPIWDDIGI